MVLLKGMFYVSCGSMPRHGESFSMFAFSKAEKQGDLPKTNLEEGKDTKHTHSNRHP